MTGGLEQGGAFLPGHKWRKDNVIGVIGADVLLKWWRLGLQALGRELCRNESARGHTRGHQQFLKPHPQSQGPTFHCVALVSPFSYDSLAADIKTLGKLGMVAYPCQASTWEAKGEG